MFFCAPLLLIIVFVAFTKVVCHHSFSLQYVCHWVLIHIFPGIDFFIRSLSKFMNLVKHLLPKLYWQPLTIPVSLGCQTAATRIFLKINMDHIPPVKGSCGRRWLRDSQSSHYSGHWDSFEDCGFYSKANKRPNLTDSLCFLVSETTSPKSLWWLDLQEYNPVFQACIMLWCTVPWDFKQAQWVHHLVSIKLIGSQNVKGKKRFFYCVLYKQCEHWG